MAATPYRPSLIGNRIFCIASKYLPTKGLLSDKRKNGILPVGERGGFHLHHVSKSASPETGQRDIKCFLIRLPPESHITSVIVTPGTPPPKSKHEKHQTDRGKFYTIEGHSM